MPPRCSGFPLSIFCLVVLAESGRNVQYANTHLLKEAIAPKRRAMQIIFLIIFNRTPTASQRSWSCHRAFIERLGGRCRLGRAFAGKVGRIDDSDNAHAVQAAVYRAETKLAELRAMYESECSTSVRPCWRRLRRWKLGSVRRDLINPNRNPSS